MFADKRTATINLLRKLNDEMFFRIYAGNFEYQRDSSQLNRHIATARTINAHGLAGRLRITHMLLELSVGNFDAVFEDIDTALADYELETDPVIKAERLSCLSNRAEVYHNLGDNEKAITLFQEVLQLLEIDPMYEDVAEPQYFYMIIGVCNTELQRYAQAKQLFEKALTVDTRRDAQYAAAIADTHRGLSEIALVEGRIDAARDAARLAQDIAHRTDEILPLFFANTALAHVAEREPAHVDDYAQRHYQAALATAERIKSPALRGIVFLHEARFHKRHANAAQAQTFARHAHNTLHENSVTVFDAELAEMLS